MNTIQISASEIEQVWRGARGSGDMMAGRGALIIRAPGTTVEIVGDADELAGLLDKLTSALTAAQW